jgi:uncharacterized protein YodC (DUF2158 family)
MPQQFRSGEAVQLKSGGPIMTVVERGCFGRDTVEGCRCRWFDDKQKLNEEVFTDAELKPYVQPRRSRMRVATSSKGL